ncbi:hypothetical protein [Arthrobacter sp. HLT1-21]
MNVISTLQDFTSQIAVITEAGGTVTTEYQRVLDRWHAYTGRESTAQAQLAAAILAKASPDRIAELHALALAELAPSTTTADVHNSTSAAVYPVLVREYEKTAEDNYEALAERFNETATRYTEAATILDPETPPEQLLHATQEKRDAWTVAGVTAAELDAQIPALTAAAKLAGTRITNNDGLLALTVNPGKLHRRRVWEAWEAEGRTGRWAALVKLGATIRACDLATYTEYRQTQPIETRYEEVGRGQWMPIETDPEDTVKHSGPTADQVAPGINSPRTRGFVTN